MPDPRSGLDDRAGWSPAFEGQRPPFEPGNALGVRHGAYAIVRLGDRTAELADQLRQLVPAYMPADDVAVQLLALALARAEAAATALEGAKPGDLARLEQDLRGWVTKATSLADKLGMTPTSRSRLRLDLALGSRTMNQLDAYVADRYGADTDDTEEAS
jgi:hypothetical protein